MMARDKMAMGIATAAALLASAAGTATAGTDEIVACVSKKGRPRFVASAGDCKEKETAVAWNMQGPAGAPGATGPEGPEGPPGDVGGTLPTGTTLRGAWAINDVTLVGMDAITFAVPLASAPTGHYVPSGVVPLGSSDCPGTAEDPQAAPGHLCVYEAFILGITVDAVIVDPRLGPPVTAVGGEGGGSGSLLPGTAPFGALVTLFPISKPAVAGDDGGGGSGIPTPIIAWGTWAVTAP